MIEEHIVDRMITVLSALLKAGIPFFYNDNTVIRRVTAVHANWVDPCLRNDPDTEPEPAIQLDNGDWFALYCVDPELFVVPVTIYRTIKF